MLSVDADVLIVQGLLNLKSCRGDDETSIIDPARPRMPCAIRKQGAESKAVRAQCGIIYGRRGVGDAWGITCYLRSKSAWRPA